MFFCINWGGTYKASLSRSQYNQYSNGYKTNYTCTSCGNPQKPWDGELSYMEYKKKEGIDLKYHQDTAFILANAQRNGTIQDMSTAYAMWMSSVSSPKPNLSIETLERLGWEVGDELSIRSKQYANFYQSTHSKFTDIGVEIDGVDRFSELAKDNTNIANINVTVNKKDGTYTVGPYNVSYPTGSYGGYNIWSWIQQITLLDQNNNVIPNIQIVSKTGELIYDSGLSDTTTRNIIYRNVPKNGEDFYVRFKTDGNAKYVKMNVEFNYLESCSAEMYNYEGVTKNRYWTSETKTHYHDHKGDYCSEHHTTHHDWKSGKRYALNETTGSTTQKLLSSVGEAKENYKVANLSVTPLAKANNTDHPNKPNKPDEPTPGIDITMNLSGRVFLDKDEGKINEGNNKIDEGEGLVEVEVTLYDTQNNQIGIMLTDEDGYYRFTKLDAQKNYYVKFTYNGMLYTNVLYNYYGDDTSKATEEGQGHSNNRKDFNSVFSEIGSYPANYKVKNDIFGLGYNRTYLQEEVADIFIEVAKKVVELNGDELAAYRAVAGNDREKQRKVQFVADCRINAYTVKTYAIPEEFVIKDFAAFVAGKNYSPIYSGVYNQTNVNLGIKARPTFDMALYKDVFNAVVEINGKSETYEYDERRDTEHKGFSVGVNESDYLNQLREKYLNGKDTNLKTKEVQASKEYTQELRSEEIINGNNANTNINADTLYDNDNNYAWRDMNYQLSQQDKMKIHITYKLSVKNQSGVKGSVTELVDYYDNHYNFEGAYVGDENGNKIEGTNVEVSDTSMYANRNATQSPSNTMYGTDGKYKTIYLRPSEQKLGSSEEQYIYVTFGLIDPENTLVNAKLMDGEKLYTYNLAEINGYRTYSEGLVDRDSNPGNFNVAEYQRGVTALEDDENQAPAFIYSKRYSRTVEGTVFEDTITSPKNANELATKQARFGSATIDEKDTPIKDVIVELVEIKQVGDQKQLIVRQATRTDEKGWYGFGALLPGDYVIRYTYGSDNQTAMTTTTPNIKGSNATSYNGQDYQATTYHTKDQEATSVETYGVDDILTQRYTINNKNKNTEEKTLTVEGQKITKYTNNGYYWYNDSAMANRSDAYDDNARKNQVIDYSKNEYGREIVNHKAEVFNSYENPQPEHITKELHAKLVSELERRTYRYAYTAEMPVEIEYTTKMINGNQDSNHYTYKITGVDFGVVQRPKAKLELTKNIEHIKVTAADGTVLFDTNKGVNNLSWTVRKDRYKKVPATQIIMDDELISGAKLEITYKFTVTNTSEIDENGNSTTRAKKIIDYVANNLTYTKEDGDNNLWQVVNKDDIQNEKNSTLINNTQNGKYKLIDLSTKQTILQTTESNPLTKALKAGESAEATLVLKKVLSAESSTDDLTYRNIAEIVEVDNTVGRYDHTSVPGNQLPDAEPTEDDTFEAETIVVLPPFGSQPVYYVIGIIAAVILAGGIYLIKKKVIDNR